MPLRWSAGLGKARVQWPSFFAVRPAARPSPHRTRSPVHRATVRPVKRTGKLSHQHAPFTSVQPAAATRLVRPNVPSRNPPARRRVETVDASNKPGGLSTGSTVALLAAFGLFSILLCVGLFFGARFFIHKQQAMFGDTMKARGPGTGGLNGRAAQATRLLCQTQRVRGDASACWMRTPARVRRPLFSAYRCVVLDKPRPRTRPAERHRSAMRQR